MWIRYFIYPAFAEHGPVTLRIEAGAPGATSKTVEIPHGRVTYVFGRLGNLEAVDRTPTTITLRVIDVVDFYDWKIDTGDDFAAFLKKIEASISSCRAYFAALVAERHSLRLDDAVAPVLAALANASGGEPVDDATAIRLAKIVESSRALVDPDRTFSSEEHRALDVLEAALRGTVSDLTVAALAASVGEAARAPDVVAKLKEQWNHPALVAERRWLLVSTHGIERATRYRPSSVDLQSYVLGSKWRPEPPRVFATTIGGSTLALIETSKRHDTGHRIELDGVPRRVRVRTNGGDWIEGEEAALSVVTEILAGAARTESPGRLVLKSEFRDDLPNSSIDFREITIEAGPTGPVSFDVSWTYESGSFY